MILLNGGLSIPLRGIHDAQVQVYEFIVRLQTQRLVVFGFSGVEVVQRREGESGVLVRFRVVWIFFERGFSFAEGGFVIACAMQDVAQLSMRFRKVGILTQDLLISVDGSGEVLLLAQQHAQGETGLRRFGATANEGVQFVVSRRRTFCREWIFQRWQDVGGLRVRRRQATDSGSWWGRFWRR